jgi:very-short-patch-repair endonuclease
MGLKTNKLEQRGRELLEELGFKNNYDFTEQTRIGRYRADIVFCDKKIIIEWDGDYWHNLEEQKKRDHKKDYYFRSRGYKVLRFWEKDVYETPEKIKQEIKNNIESPENILLFDM